MFDNTRFVATYYAVRTMDRAAKAANDTKEFVGEHKSEMTRTAALSSVVYLVSRSAGFKAGYEYATTAV